MTQKTDCLQCQGEGGRWTPFWSSYRPNPEVKPIWSICEYCSGRGWIDPDREPTRGFHPAGAARPLAIELHEAGFEVRAVGEDQIATLHDLSPPDDYLHFVREFGLVSGSDGYDMLAPDEVRQAVKKQRDFYDGATFGDSEEDQQALEAEAAFRRRLIPFQYAGTRGDFFCYLMSDDRAPIILDVYHDDFEMAGAGVDEEPTPYTTALGQHLRWVLELIEFDDGTYPR